VVVTETASDLGPTSARLNATVDPKDSPTAVVFEYSTDPDLLPPYAVTTFAGSIAAGIADAAGIAPDGHGGVFVADRSNRRFPLSDRRCGRCGGKSLRGGHGQPRDSQSR
jgi:hypothetical protein